MADASIVGKLLDPPDRRSIGRADEVVRDILADPLLFDSVFRAMTDDEATVRMRSADAVEKVSRIRPELVHPYVDTLLVMASGVAQKEVRWHVAQLLGRVPLTPEQRDRAVTALVGYLSDDSSIVKTFAMHTLADLAERDQEVYAVVVPLIEGLSTTGTPAMRARGRKLLARHAQ